MGDYKKQHYVPQTYLRRFAADGKRLYVFDKLHQDSGQRVRVSNIRDIAHENDFYDIPTEVIKPEARPGHNRKMIENLLSRFDAELGSEVERLVITGGKSAHDLHSRARLARALGVQALRTRDMRDTVVDVYQQAYQALVRDLTVRNFSGQEHLTPKVQMKPEYMAVRHAAFMLESGTGTVGRAFFTHTWVMGINETCRPLYTSDQPVVRFTHFDQSNLSNEGFASSGIEVAFPLDSEHILIMRHAEVPGVTEGSNGSTETLSGERVEFYNRMQVEQSRRQVYCRDNAFDLAAEMCSADPELCALTGRKATVEIVPTDDPLRSLIVTNVRATRKGEAAQPELDAAQTSKDGSN